MPPLFHLFQFIHFGSDFIGDFNVEFIFCAALCNAITSPSAFGAEGCSMVWLFVFVLYVGLVFLRFCSPSVE